MAVKRCKTREEMSLSSEGEDGNNTRNDTDLDKAKNEYQVQL